MAVITFSLVFLSLLVLHSSDAMMFPTKIEFKSVHHVNEPQQEQMPSNFRVRKSAGQTHPTCHRSAITERCSLTGDFEACVLSSCSECIPKSDFNGLDMHCIPLTACVCSIIKDGSCYAMTADCN